ncbi:MULTISPECIES: hypothetical protein [unclassified Lentimicrobium]|uniref:hypothetical protein n=1 Tax=unclassified Lentimicrobium TaxID=2677434 RepID=UPI001552A758|nr:MULTISPECIES: hypothetical protein [unclassified Lentimicrobium]NPD46047.1 hypothetical protein [Lentimicrobium sp. S6]NPD84951.1 hypothetical protein [Lentimicrobium sp. L6]
MKKSILTLFIFAVLFSACKKDEEEEPTPPTKEELLCQTWNIDTYYLNGHGYAYLTWQYVWKFKTDGSIEWRKIENGELYKTTTWAWAENQTALDITVPDWNDKTARTTIKKLTETEMILEPGETDIVLEMTFSR